MGKAGQSEGDTLDSPTEEFIYDFDCFETSSTPIHVRTRRREVHGSSTCRWLESVEYSDGAGRVVLAKAVAEPGKYKTLENGSVIEKDSGTDVRWVGSGRTVYNNAGNPVKQYEPYFSGTDAYESEPAIVETGVTPVLHYDPLDRLVRTDLPDGTFSRAEFATWEQRNFDQDDTVLESAWYADRNSPDPTGSEPANAERRAAWLAAKHAGTPSVEYLDAQGRPFYGVADNGTRGRYATLTVFDVLGNPLSVKDAKGRVVMAYAYNSLSAACRTESMDAGERRTLPAVDGLPVLGFDARNHRLRSVYDALRRPTEQWLSGNGGAEKLVGRTVYGESAANPEVSNLRGMAWKSYDQGGLVENAAYDFKGNLLQGSRQFARAYNQTIDWNVTDPDSLLESETFTTTTAYDALNRATSIRTPHNVDIPTSEILPGYNEANLLERVDVKLRGATTATNFVQNIDYDAKGQRERIQYGNGSTTGYTYDEKTFRLKRLLTTRNNGADILQDLNYTYDAVGNVTQIDDSAQQTIFFNGSVVSPSQKFEYDALYRLIKATGREHVSVNADSEPEAEGYNAAQISPQDGTAMRNYAREWRYDSVGNILSIIHDANGNAWTRTNAYAADSNRLNSTAVGQTTASFAYNAHGSMTSMPHLSAMDWDFAEKLCHVTRGTTEAYYNYDGSGIRTRKVVEKNGVVETRLYLGGFEIWRKTVNGVLDTERETLHVMDDQKRIALVETLTVENGNAIANPVPVQRYQLDNHLGSASLELDESASIISYEEFYPYGDTCYRAGRSASEVSQKRYRYTGKEKDEESSLYYCEQRYYAAHISRWVSTDPTWLEDGINIYAYVHGNPVNGADPHGTNEENVVEDECANQPSEAAQKRADAAKTMVTQYIKNGTRYSQEERQFGIDAQYSDCSSLVSSILEYAGQGNLFESKSTGRGNGGGIQGEIRKKEGADDLKAPYRMNNPKIGDIMMWKGHIGLVTDVTEENVQWANMGVKSSARIQRASLTSESDLRKGAEIYASEFWGFWTPVDEGCAKLEERGVNVLDTQPESSSSIISSKGISSAQEASMEKVSKQVESSFSQKMELKMNELKHELNRLNNPMNWILGR